MSDLAVLMIWFVASVISGIIGAFIGNLRGRVKAGFWLGFIFEPIGWIIVLLLPHAGFVKCPHCGGDIPRRQDTCAHCKNKVSWSKTGDRAFRASTPVR